MLYSYILPSRNPPEIMNIAALSRKVLKLYLSVEMAHLLLALLLQKPVRMDGSAGNNKGSTWGSFPALSVKYSFKLGFFIQVVK